MTIAFIPAIDPIAFTFFGHEVRWYGLMYVVGILFVHWFLRRAVHHGQLSLSKSQLDGLILLCFLGLVVGARTVYVALYNPDYFLANSGEILALAKGGFSFHGASLGIGLALWAFARSQHLSFLRLSDHICAAAPLGLALGRLGNFINQELWGRPSDAPWAMVFPRAGLEPRHPSQLYESFLEGWLLLALTLWLYRKLYRQNGQPAVGLVTALFLIGYAAARILAEQFREPDVQLGFFFSDITMGQILSLVMMVAGVLILVFRPALSR